MRQAAAPSRGLRASSPPFERKGVSTMVTWEALFSFCLLIVSVISLVEKHKKK